MSFFYDFFTGSHYNNTGWPLAGRATRIEQYTCREHTDASHDPIEWRSSSIARKCGQRYQEKPYFEVEIDFFYVAAEVMNVRVRVPRDNFHHVRQTVLSWEWQWCGHSR